MDASKKTTASVLNTYYCIYINSESIKQEMSPVSLQCRGFNFYQVLLNLWRSLFHAKIVTLVCFSK